MYSYDRVKQAVIQDQSLNYQAIKELQYIHEHKTDMELYFNNCIFIQYLSCNSYLGYMREQLMIMHI